MSKTLEQRRAEHAVRAIRGLEPDKPERYGNYVSYVSALPAQIIMNGLGQALATLVAAAGRSDEGQNDAHYLLYDHVSQWLAQEISQLKGPDTDFGVIERLLSSDQAVYVRAQAESLAYLNWLKKFARAMLEEKRDDEAKQGSSTDGAKT